MSKKNATKDDLSGPKGLEEKKTPEKKARKPRKVYYKVFVGEIGADGNIRMRENCGDKAGALAWLKENSEKGKKYAVYARLSPEMSPTVEVVKKRTMKTVEGQE